MKQRYVRHFFISIKHYQPGFCLVDYRFTGLTFSIGHARDVMSDDSSSNTLFTHAILGCDTTSRVLGVGKRVSLRLVQESDTFRAQASIFRKQSATKEEIAAAGEKAMIQLFKGKEADSLNDLGLKRFYSKVTDSKMASIHPRNLPTTSSSAMFHSFRVYHQVQERMENLLPPEQWSTPSMA